MIGDCLMFINSNPFGFGCPSCNILKFSTSNYSNAIESVKKLVNMDVETYHPAHDSAALGLKKDAIQLFLNHL
jgi:hypothetical protein